MKFLKTPTIAFFCLALPASMKGADAGELRGINVTLAPQPDGAIELTVDEQALVRSGKTSGERVLERSADLQTWTELARLPGSATGSQYVDENPPPGRGFYRVRVEETPDAAPGEVLVQFRADADADGIEALTVAAGLTAPLEIIETKLMEDSGAPPVTRFLTSLDPEIAAGILRASPFVIQAAPNLSVSVLGASSASNDPFVTDGRLWGLSDEPFGANAYGAWAAGKTGSDSVVVAVIDTGVGPHPDLAPNMFVNPFEVAGNGIDDDGNGYVDDVCGWDFWDLDADASDSSGHGTHVAGTIGAAGNNGQGVAGVGWNLKILPLKVFGTGGGTGNYIIARAIDYATDLRRRGVNIAAINLSLGGDPQPKDRFPAATVYVREAISRAAQAGILVVCAAGNDSNDNDAFPVSPASIDPTIPDNSGLQAGWDNVISVAALERRGLLSSYSNYGLRGVDLAAPGGDRSEDNWILSTLPGGNFGYKIGTSMAAPHVTGAVALYASTWAADGASIKHMLLQQASPTSSQAGRSLTGGRLEISALVARPPGNVNRNPVTRDDIVPLSTRTAIEIRPLANDSDPDGHSLQVASFTLPRTGTVVRKSSDPNTLVFTPGLAFNGSDSFGYTAVDALGATALGAICIKDPAVVNVPPTANRDHVVVEAGGSFELMLLLWNDRDPNGDRIRFHCAGSDCGYGPANGSISGGRYLPNVGFTGTDAFGYTITDGTHVATGTVTVEVMAAGGRPRVRVELSRPDDKAAKVRRAPLFRWKAARGAVTYDLEICLGRPGRDCRGYAGISGLEFRIPAHDALPANTKCHWRVRPVAANGAPGTWSTYRSFTSRTAAPPDRRPVLVWPPNAATGIPLTPMITWEAVEDADAYHVQVAKGLPETTSIPNGFSVVTEESGWQVPQELALESGHVYFWRVMAKNDEGDGQWSDWQPFSCGVPAPVGKPVLRSPANAATGISVVPVLDWDDLAGASAWRVQVRRIPDAAVIADVSGIAGSQYTVAAGALAPGQSYDWRVQPANGAGTGVWSDRWSFRTRVESPVALLSPPNDDFNLQRSVTLSWSSAAGADGYDYEVYEGSTLVAGYGITYANGPYRATSVSLTFDYGKSYRWRVRARILPQDNPWTQTWNFTVKGAPAFSLVSPANGTAGLNRSVTLDWSSHPDADGYDFEVLDGSTPVAGYGINYSGGPYRATSVSLTFEYGKTYRWRARPRIYPQDNPWSAYWSFSVKGDPGFSLISPADGAANLATTVRLDWSSHADADGYDFEVYDGGTKVAGMDVTYSGGPYRGTAVNVALGYGKTYTWRARPRILPQNNPWSASRSFSTEAPPPVVPGIPVLVSPAHHASGVARPVTFDWQGAPNAVRYRLEVWYAPSDGSARQRVLNKTVTATSYKAGSPDPDPLGPGRNYYWKVRGINSAGQEGVWSSERHFSTRTTP